MLTSVFSVGRVAFNKQEGEFYVNAAIGAISPGFNVNDLGFAWKTDIINAHLVLGYPRRRRRHCVAL